MSLKDLMQQTEPGSSQPNTQPVGLRALIAATEPQSPSVEMDVYNTNTDGLVIRSTDMTPAQRQQQWVEDKRKAAEQRERDLAAMTPQMRYLSRRGYGEDFLPLLKPTEKRTRILPAAGWGAPTIQEIEQSTDRDFDKIFNSNIMALPDGHPLKDRVMEYRRIQDATIKELQKRGIVKEPRKYKNFWDETKVALARGTANVGTGLMSALAEASGDAIWDADPIYDLADQLYEYTKMDQFAPGEGGGLKGTIANAVGEAVPYVLASAGATAVTGSPLMGAGSVGYMVEGQDAYNTAIENGASEEDAQMNRFLVGTINGGIEALQIGEIFKFAKEGKTSVKAIADSARRLAWKELAIHGKEVGLKEAQLIVSNALEEALQESSSMLFEARHRDIEGDEIVDRIKQSAIGGGIVGGMFGTGGAAVNAAFGGGQDLTPGIAEDETTAVTPLPTAPDRGVGPEVNDLTDSGTMAVLGVLKQLGLSDSTKVKISGKVHTLADSVQEGLITEERAISMLKDAGFEESEDLGTINIVGKNYVDKFNNAVIRLYKGHDAQTVLHEFAEQHFKALYGERADTVEINKLRQEYEDATGDVREGNNREWLADMAVERAIQQKFHKSTGQSLRQIFNKFRDRYIDILARVRNLSRYSREGKLSQELMDVLDKPFDPIRSAKAAGEIGATYQLSQSQQKLMDATGTHLTGGIARENPRGWITPDGHMVVVTDTHDQTAAMAGTSMSKLLKDGTMRVNKSGNAFIAEIGDTIIPTEMASTLKQWLSKQFQPGAIFTLQHGDNYATYQPDSRADIGRIIDSLAGKKPTKQDLMATYELRRSPEGKVTKSQLAQGHIIPDMLEMSPAARKKFMENITGKTSMKDMNYGEAEQFVEGLKRVARNQGIEVDGIKHFADGLSHIINKYSKVKSSPDKYGLKPRGLAGLAYRLRKGLTGYLYSATHMERLLWSLNGYEKGPLYNALYSELRSADENANLKFVGVAQGLQNWVNENLSKKQRKDLFRKTRTNITKDFAVDASERMNIYMLAKNENGHRRLVEGNKIDDAKIRATVAWMKKNAPYEIELADKLLSDYEQQFEAFRIAHLHATGEEITKEEFYSPLYMQGVNLEQQEDFLSLLLSNRLNSSTRAHIGETIERSRKAIQPVRLDALGNYLYNTNRVARYTEMAPTLSRISRIVNNRGFKKSLQNATYDHGLPIITKWVSDIANGSTGEVANAVNNMALAIRRNGITYLLGMNAASALRQPLSIFPAMAVSPRMVLPVLQHLMLSANPLYNKRLEKFVYERSNLMKTRSWDRIETILRKQLNAEQRILGKTPLSTKYLSALRWMDKRTTAIVWKSAYDMAEGAGFMDEKSRITFADNVVERTQPMGGPVHLPHYFRGGLFERLMTTFERQVNQNFNFWAYDVLGQRKAGKISNTEVVYKILMSYVMPALLMGMINRGGTPGDPEDIMEDMVTYPIAGVLFFGRIANSIIKGYEPGSTVIDVPFRELGKLGPMIPKALNGDEDVDIPDATWQAIRTISAFTGLVPKQAFVTAEGAADLAEGDTSDIRRLLYTERALNDERQGTKGRFD